MTPMRSVTLVMTGSKLTNLSNYLSVSTTNEYFLNFPKGQIMSECIYEITDFPKYHQKNLIDFCPGRSYRLGACDLF